MGGRLRPVPGRPPRVLGIVRVSKERDDMGSPEIQEHAILGHCAARGYELVPAPDGQPFLYGIDESGSQRKSSWWRKLDEAVGLVESGAYDGIVVWKFSRTARLRLRWAVALDRVEVVGGLLESATENFDVTTSSGRLARGMIAEINAFEAERIGEQWKETHDRRVRSGRPHSGKAKWGYVYDRARKVHVPHPEQGPVLRDMYRRYVAGESVYGLVRWLNGHGWRTLAGKPWSDRTLRRVLDSGFAAGWFSYQGELHQGVHEPLIDADLWQAYLDARADRRTLPPARERSVYLLSGLVRCARCGWTMTASFSDPGLKWNAKQGRYYTNGRPHLKYRCGRSKEQGREQCRGGYVKESVLEAVVLDYLRGLAAEVEEGARAKAASLAKRTVMEAEVARLAREAGRVEEALVRLAVSNAEHPLPSAVYERSRGELEQRAGELSAAIEALGRSGRRTTADPAATAAGLLESWDLLPVVGRREVLRGLIDCVMVRSGRDVERLVFVVPWEEVRP